MERDVLKRSGNLALAPSPRDGASRPKAPRRRVRRLAAVGDGLTAEPFVPPLDVPARRRWEVREADQSPGVAVGFEEVPAGLAGLCRVVVDAGREFWIPRLQW